MATPVQVKSKINPPAGGSKSKVVVDGDKIVDVSLVPDAKVGDWLLVHGELAVNKISDLEAQNIFELIKKCDHKH